MNGYYLIPSDCLTALRKMPDNSIDSLVTDPPYGWRFMGKAWDAFDIENATQVNADVRAPRTDGRNVPRDSKSMYAGLYNLSLAGNQAFQAWTTEWAHEALRVLKPGAHILVFCGPRTYHRMAAGVEDAGFEIRDQLQWLFGSGFPKSHNLGKATGLKEWEGWGTALKPANEPILLARKPLSEKTVAANVLKHGTGGINIDASRVTTEDNLNGGAYSDNRELSTNEVYGEYKRMKPSEYKQPQGRFPANLVLSHNEDCVEVGVKKVKLNGSGKCSGNTTKDKSMFGIGSHELSHGNGDGTETVAAFQCSEGCAVAMLDEQSGILKSGGSGGIRKNGGGWKQTSDYIKPNNLMAPDSGGASRFFYCAKSSKSERNEGCEGLAKGLGKRNFSDGMEYKLQADGSKTSIQQVPESNTHPTVKPTKLMSYLIKLITPPNGVVLDPFLGSGSTGVAALREGFDFIGIEKEIEYFKISLARIRHVYYGDDHGKI